LLTTGNGICGVVRLEQKEQQTEHQADVLALEGLKEQQTEHQADVPALESLKGYHRVPEKVCAQALIIADEQGTQKMQKMQAAAQHFL
jgi:hypothetical protein